MLKIQFKDNHRDPMWVMEKNFSIGSDKNNHLALIHESIAPFHAKLSNLGDRFVVKDIANAGVYVNGQQITQKNVSCNDTVRIGDIEFTILDPVEETQVSDEPYWSLIADSNWLTGQEFPIVAGVGETIIIGRNSECDIIFPGTHLSRKHASVQIGRTSLKIMDLGSANGTFLNENPIKQETLVHPGDRLRFDVYSFRVFGPGINLPTSSSSKSNAKTLSGEDASSAKLTNTKDDKIHSPKKWKTRPTSPGNREEPRSPKQEAAVAWAVAAAILVGFIALSVLLLL